MLARWYHRTFVEGWLLVKVAPALARKSLLDEC